MAYDLGPKIGIDGEAEFRRQIQQINTTLKTLGTEMTAVTSAFIGQEKSTDALAAKNNVLKKSVASLEAELELQKKMLAESAAAFGTSDERTLKWQQTVNRTTAELNKAQAEISANNREMAKLTASIQDNSDELEDNGRTVEDTAGKHEGAMARIKSAASAAMKVVAAALAAGTVAITGLASQSLDLYGDYQQLTGGVETLFKESSAQVMEYANNAYKTAGLSANEYMETVTGFSASLLQSLGGDTAAAARTADQALTDMADNANKMGTAMESIQNAYQGFAKQNYTMLDNLKLGYGGTKEEMERLLADAQALSGVEYDISSFADIVEAIHVVQTEMGITGTTALEASQTIQGSVAAMSSAWENLVIGLGDSNADMEQQVDNVVESVTTMLENVVPVVENVLGGIGTAVEGLAPVISEKLPPLVESVTPGLLSAASDLILALASGLLAALPELAPVATDIIGELTGSILSLLPELVPASAGIITALASGLTDNLPQLLPAAADIIVNLADALTDPEMLGEVFAAALDLVISLAQGLIKALPELLAAVPKIINNLFTFMSGPDFVPRILATAAELIASLVIGLIAALPELVGTGVKLLAAILGGIKDGAQKIKEIGGNIVRGLWEGIQNMGAWLGEKVSGFFGGIVDGVKGFLGIHSPSTVFAGIGKNMAAGLAQGWDNAYKDVARDIERGLNFDAPDLSPTMDMPGLTMGRPRNDLAELMEGMVNGIQTATAGNGDSMPTSATIILPAADGTVLARWVLPDLRAVMRDDPQV